MFYKRRTFLFLFLLFFSIGLIAQNEAITEPQLLYMKRVQWGMNLNSTGLGGLNFKYGWHKTGTVNNMIDIEFARVRHYKEIRSSNNSSDNPRQYTFGRLNMAFFLRTGYGQNIAITERPYKNAASLHFNYSLGVTTAILKPIYLDIKRVIPDPNTGTSYTITVSQRYDPNVQTDPSTIMGNSVFTNGLNELSIYFGGYGKASLAVEWGPYPDEFKSIEAGVVFDAFANPLPLMAFVPRDYFFAQLFIEFTFGSNK